MTECIKKLEDCFYIVKKKLKEEDSLIKNHMADVEFAIERLITAIEVKENK
jgi:hypothetical protein